MEIKQQLFTDRFQRMHLTKEQRIAQLERIKLSEALRISMSELSHLAEFLTPYQGASGAVVFRKGDEESFMCLIVSGTVMIYARSREEAGEAIGSLGQGSLVGEMALIDGEPRSAYAYTASETVLFVMTRSNFYRLSEDYPAIWGKLILSIAQLMSSRLRKTNENLGKHLHLKWTRIMRPH